MTEKPRVRRVTWEGWACVGNGHTAMCAEPEAAYKAWEAEERVSSKFTRMAMRSMVKQMMAKRYFDICLLRPLGDSILGDYWNLTPEYKRISAYHCVEWEQMEPDMRGDLLGRCILLLGGDPNTLMDDDAPGEEAPKATEEDRRPSIWRRIFGH